MLVFDATSFQPMKGLPLYSTLLQVFNGKGAFKELTTDIVIKEDYKRYSEHDVKLDSKLSNIASGYILQDD